MVVTVLAITHSSDTQRVSTQDLTVTVATQPVFCLDHYCGSEKLL